MKKIPSFVVYGLFLLPVSLGCSFPQFWHGEYFHVEYSKPLVVGNKSITEKGECVWNSGSQYVLESKDQGETCWRCLSIHRKHQNVLQYKESDCEYQNQFSSLEDLCRNIPGDGHMHSMFRRNGTGTHCPLHGPHMFTYSKGGTTGPSCEYPKSYLDTCHDNQLMKLHYQACIDVKGSQSKTEDWKCIASWNEGSRGYFVGELVDDYPVSDQARFRCFVHDKDYDSKGALRMGVSGFATCNGLPSPLHGDKVFTLEKVLGSGVKCRYPGWLAEHHTWQALNGRQQIHINSGVKSLKIRSDSSDLKTVSEEHLSCQNILPESEQAATDAPIHLNQPKQSLATTYVNSPSDNSYNTKSSGNLVTLDTSNLSFQHNKPQHQKQRDLSNIQHLEINPPKSVKIVQHVKSGCESGYVCTQLTRLTYNLMSLQTGAVSRDPKETCKSYYFSNPKSSMYIARARHPIACPLNGRYTFMLNGDRHLINNNKESSVLEAGCPGASMVQLSSGCGAKQLTFKCDHHQNPADINKNKTELNFQCHAHWSQDGVSNLILTLADNIGYYCLTYTDYGMSLVSGDCQVAGAPVQHRFSSTGPCIQALSATRSSSAQSSQHTANLGGLIFSSSLLIYILNQ